MMRPEATAAYQVRVQRRQDVLRRQKDTDTAVNRVPSTSHGPCEHSGSRQTTGRTDDIIQSALNPSANPFAPLVSANGNAD